MYFQINIIGELYFSTLKFIPILNDTIREIHVNFFGCLVIYYTPLYSIIIHFNAPLKHIH